MHSNWSPPLFFDAIPSTAEDSPELLEKFTVTREEASFFQCSWSKAVQEVDVGAELVVRLLNDKRSLFKSLLESQVGAMEIETFTVEIINRECPRAKRVGEGVVRFFNKAMMLLDSPTAVSDLRKMSIELGALHYKMKVWFQAENWLCVKNSLLEIILGKRRKDIPKCFNWFGMIFVCNSMHSAPSTPTEHQREQRASWTKLIQFVIRNMKRGFLAEALKSPPNSLDISSSPEISSS